MPKPTPRAPSDAAPADTPVASAEPVTAEQSMLETFLQQRGRVESHLSRWIACRSTAADLCQELFIRLWRRRDIQVQNLDQYMMRSARNLAIDHLRSQGSRQRAEASLLPEQWESPPTGLEDGHQAAAQLRQVEHALRGLPERTRHVFLLNRIHGQSYAQIASAMGVSVSAVEKHMMRALRACKHSVRAPARGSQA